MISELPDNLRSLAENVPVFCEWEMAQHWLNEGAADDSKRPAADGLRLTARYSRRDL